MNFGRSFIAGSILAVSLSVPALCQAGELARNITFNGRPLAGRQMILLERLEQYHGVRIPDGRYWYDNRAGLAGRWGGPALATLPAGLGFGGPMPANCSGGRTGVFVNGRELHTYDVMYLSQLGPVYRGRYWLDASGYYGLEGGPPLGNLVAAINSRGQRSGGGQRRVYAPGELSGMIVNEGGAMDRDTGTTAYPGR